MCPQFIKLNRIRTETEREIQRESRFYALLAAFSAVFLAIDFWAARFCTAAYGLSFNIVLMFLRGFFFIEDRLVADFRALRADLISSAEFNICLDMTIISNYNIKFCSCQI
jgi:hypothetical protein